MGIKRFFREHGIILLLFLIVSIIYTLPLFMHFSSLGILDWDLWMFYNEAARKSILEFKQIPLWNPYYCGGNILLAHPESQIFSLVFLFVLIFGTLVGIKIAVLIHLFIGLLGMYFLARYFKLPLFAAIAAAFVYMLSAPFSMRVGIGHFSYLALGFYPLAFLFFLKARHQWKYAIASSALLALAFFTGAVYELFFFIFFILLYSILKSLSEKNARYLFIALFIYLVFFLIASIKLVPLLDFVNDNPRAASFSVEEGTSVSDLFDYVTKSISVNRYYDTENPAPPDAPRWWEGMLGLGAITFIFLVLGLFACWKKDKVFIFTTAFFIALSLGNYFPINLWKLIHYFPPFSSFYVISRTHIILLFCFSLLVGFGFSLILDRFTPKKFHTATAIILLSILGGSLWLMNQPLLSDAVGLEIPSLNYSPFFYQTVNVTKYNGISSSSHYLTILENKGDLTCFEQIRGETSVSAIPREFSSYKGEAYLSSGENTKYVYFSPRKIIIETNTSVEDVLVLNQNYANGWRSSVGKPFNYNGLLAVHVSPGFSRVEFSYFSERFLVGAILSFVSLLLIVLFIIGWKRKMLFLFMLICVFFTFFYIYGIQKHAAVPSFYETLKNDNNNYAIIELPLTTPLPRAFLFYNEFHGKEVLWHHNSQKLTYKLFLIKKIFFADDAIDSKQAGDILNQDTNKDTFSILNYYNVKKIIFHKKWYGSHIDWLIFSGPASPYNYSKYKDWYGNEHYNKTKAFLDSSFQQIYEDEDVIVYNVPENNNRESFMIMGDGWSWQETDFDGKTFNWMGKKTSLNIIAFDSNKKMLQIATKYTFNGNRTLQVYHDGEPVYSTIVIGKQGLSVPLILHKGENLIELRSKEGCDKPSSVSESRDKRCLSLAIMDIRLT
ncbi:hypothetical protein HY500_00525 [Candidatus Woesearchaeota archaeon]|nr:hypothetical protein [Candidatus Woesearchaeota archaeon]